MGLWDVSNNWVVPELSTNVISNTKLVHRLPKWPFFLYMHPSASIFVVHCNDVLVCNEISLQILLFNCMEVRDPQLLLPQLIKTCASSGMAFPEHGVFFFFFGDTLPRCFFINEL